MRQPTSRHPKSVTVSHVISQFLAEKTALAQRGQYGDDSLRKVRFYLGIFSEYQGENRIEDCRRSDLRRWILSHPEWQAPATLDQACRTVITCFRWAANEVELITHCPFARPANLIPPLRQRVSILPEEYQAIMDYARSCNGRDRRARSSRSLFRNAVFFLWETGSRTCEMRSIRWTDVDWDAGVIRLEDHKTAAKTGRVRLIPLTKKLLRLLRLLKRHALSDKDCIFQCGHGKEWTQRTFAEMFAKYAVAAGVRPGVTPYSLRHGFTVRGLEAGIGDRQLADVLGHTTTRYIAWYGRATRTKAEYLCNITERITSAKGGKS